jgi:CO/xanthine dehydrogenase Mo-binding subunit
MSRNITVVTKLVELAAVAIRKQRFRDPLPIRVSRSVKPARVPAWETAGEAGQTAETVSIDQNALAHAGWGAAVVEVEIDPVEYIPRVRGVWMSIDAGKILSQRRAWQTLRSSVVHALGWSSREILSYEAGRIPEGQLKGCHIPDPADIPPIHIDFIWNDAAPPKGIGDIAFNCLPPAYVQAVSQATDHPFRHLPISTEDVWAAFQQKQETVTP